MKRLAIATGVVVLGTGAAMAFDGCREGSFSSTVTEDSLTYSLLFDELFVESADFEDKGRVATCDIAVPLVGVPKGTIAVYTADYRGFLKIDEGSDASIGIENHGSTLGEEYEGPFEEDFTYLGMAASDGDSTLRSRATIDLTGAEGEDELGIIDSAEYVEVGRITLGTDQMAIATHIGASTELLTGANQGLEGPDEFGIFGGVGSAQLGGTARFNLADGFSILGGASLISQGYETSEAAGAVGAVAVRWVQPGVTSFRPFAEGGVTLGGLQLNFNDVPGGDESTGVLLGSVHVRGGVEAALDDINTVTLAGSIQETVMGVRGYTLTDGGPFTADMPDQAGYFTKLKASASWRAQVTSDIDVEATGAVGALISHGEVVADVDGLGVVTATAPASMFVEYGVRAGWNLAPGSRVEGFVQGSTSNDYGTHAQIGAAYKLQF
jgi:hypothetical protein